LVSKIAREKVTVALSADAGDEIFAGYERYGLIMKYGKRIQGMPPVLRKTVASLMNNIPSGAIPFLKNKYLFRSRYEKVKSFLKDPSEQNILTSLSKNSSDAALEVLFKNKISFVQTAFESRELKNEYFSTLAYTMAVDYQTYLSDDILQKVDRATMSVGLEGREPFLDQHIIEWAAQLPLEYKFKDGQKKIILKDIVHKYVPKQMMDRPKMGFGIPIEQWLRGSLKPLVEYYFDPSFLSKQNIFNSVEVQRIKYAFYTGQLESPEKIWYLLTFQMWYAKWMLNE
jgi:asparagine synthase (glutamine-hydrolysing)